LGVVDDDLGWPARSRDALHAPGTGVTRPPTRPHRQRHAQRAQAAEHASRLLDVVVADQVAAHARAARRLRARSR
jgi:hypothetical protein